MKSRLITVFAPGQLSFGRGWRGGGGGMRRGERRGKGGRGGVGGGGGKGRGGIVAALRCFTTPCRTCQFTTNTRRSHAHGVFMRTVPRGGGSALRKRS